jgi:hypothetical protein
MIVNGRTYSPLGTPEPLNVMASENQGSSAKKISPRRLLAAEKQRRALEMKIAGATLEQIAAELGYTRPSGATPSTRSIGSPARRNCRPRTTVADPDRSIR